MKLSRHQLRIFVGIALVATLTGCSKDDNVPVPPVEPIDPSTNGVALAQFQVLLGDQTTSGNGSSRVGKEIEDFNHPKIAFAAADYFTLSYNNAVQTAEKAYAYTSDGKTWSVHEKEEANSPLKVVLLDTKSPTLSASYLSAVAIRAGADKDGIVTKTATGGEMSIGCFDALNATATVTVNNGKATATIPFKHINHLLNFYIRGTLSENMISHLILDVTYNNAAGTVQKAVLSTSSRASYADTDGTAHTVIQAIVPRNAVVKGIRAVKQNDAVLTGTEAISLECAGGKSHLVTLNINGDALLIQVGSLIDDWAYSGAMNPDGTPVGDIEIKTADELRLFSAAVNANPATPVAKINGVLAYTAHVVQKADIDLSGLPWRPIGGNTYNDDEGNLEVAYFAGTYNGNGFKISGLNLTSTTTTGHRIVAYAGLFGNVQSPAEGYTVLTDIELVNVSIKLQESIDYSAAGALAGLVYAPTGKKQVVISQCSAQGTVEVGNNRGKVAAGGLIGEAIRAHITGSITDVSVTTNAGIYSYAGGMIGRALDSSIASSYAKNAVSGQSSNGTSLAGGIVGFLDSQNEFCHILATTADGNVTANGKEVDAGGIVGYNEGNLTGCYARGNVTSTSNTAKLGGIAAVGASGINLCYGVGAVGIGSSNIVAKPDNVVYKTTPSAGDILSIVSGKSWKTSHGSEMAEATVGGILTTIAIYSGGKSTQEVKSRLWVLSDADVWSVTSPASNIYPQPVRDYKGE